MVENALISACFFIPLDIDIPFLTERYQDIFQPYASGSGRPSLNRLGHVDCHARFNAHFNWRSHLS